MTVNINETEQSRHNKATRAKRPAYTSIAFSISAGLHVILALIMIFGLPKLYTPTPEQQPIPIELEFIDAPIDVDTKSDKVPDNKTRKKLENDKRIDKPKKKYTPPKMTAMAPPKLIKPEPPKPAPKQDTKPTEPEIIKTPDAKKQAIITKKPKTRPKKPKAPKSDKKPDNKPVTEQDEKFSSMLRSLITYDNTDDPDEIKTAPVRQKPKSQIKTWGDEITVSEQDALMHQFEKCWSFQGAGSKRPESLKVEIRLFVNPDRTVRDHEIIDTSLLNSDSYFRSAADAAVRAINNPICRTLRLPENKQDQWDIIVVTFDPSEMF